MYFVYVSECRGNINLFQIEAVLLKWIFFPPDKALISQERRKKIPIES